MPSILGKHFRWQFDFFCYISQKIGFDNLHEMWELIVWEHMKDVINLLSPDVINLSLAENMIKVKRLFIYENALCKYPDIETLTFSSMIQYEYRNIMCFLCTL